MASPALALQFRLVLEGIEPPVWRRIQIPADFTLAQLHRVIQAVMDWQDYHLHEFTVTGRAYGVPDPDFDADREVADDRVVRLRDLNLSVGDRIQYAYDFGDDWQHGLELEDVGRSDAANTSPACLDGERSAPPEDVGGPPGYEEFLQALSDPDHEEHEHMKSWVGRPFDPKYFSVEEANQRLRKRFRHRKSAQKA